MILFFVNYNFVLETGTTNLELSALLTCHISVLSWSFSLPAENKFAVGSGAKTVCICYYEQENNW